MKRIYDKIRDERFPDSEIIRDVESAKNEPGFDINWEDNTQSLLIIAILHDREELVRYLLTYPEIDVNHVESDLENTSLHVSCCDRRVPILKLLLSHRDINVNIQNTWRWTGLHNACRYNHIEIVKELLLDARVDVMIRDELGETARDDAIRERHYGITNILKMMQYTSLLRIPNEALLHDIVRMIIEEYV